ncbi:MULTISPECIES: hypothetical protein [Ramlibacter]|uniref:hypothetical protein n=1 Tax=Ramlibacter TaxID=174951 RepID=UPI0014324607|nr:hypothetical protein [Ramlibacter rhizophilus]
MQEDPMYLPQIKAPFAAEYLALIAVGATHQEAVAQIAQSNEIDPVQVEAECASN